MSGEYDRLSEWPGGVEPGGIPYDTVPTLPDADALCKACGMPTHCGEGYCSLVCEEEGPALEPKPTPKLSPAHAAALQPLWYEKPLPEPSRELYRELIKRRYPQGLGRAIGTLELIAGAKTLVEAKRLAAKAIFDDAALDAAMEALEKLTERGK